MQVAAFAMNWKSLSVCQATVPQAVWNNGSAGRSLCNELEELGRVSVPQAVWNNGNAGGSLCIEFAMNLHCKDCHLHSR